MKSLRGCVVGAGAVALAALTGSRDAHAAGFANTRIGGEEGSVVATNPTALYYNPGAMGMAAGSQLGFYGSLALRHATYSRQPAPSDPPPPTGFADINSGSNHVFNAFGGPTMGGTLKLGNLTIGAGFFAPFYGRAHWPQNPEFENSKFPLAAAGVQRWFGIDGAISVLYFTAGAAYRFGPISIGAAGNFISTTLDQTQAKTSAGASIPDSSQEGRAFVDASAFNGSFSAGLMAEIVPGQFWFGASYQAQPGMGQQKLHGELELSAPKVQNDISVDFFQTLPDVIRAGFRWRMKNAPLEFRLFGDLTRWSQFKSQCEVVAGTQCSIGPDLSDTSIAGNVQANVQRNWHDTYGGRLGVSWWVLPEIELLFGTGFETAASPDTTLAPDLPDADNVSGTFGARFRLTQSLFFTASYTQLQYFNRDTTGKSRLATNFDGSSVPVPTFEEDSGGQYTQWIGILNGNLEALF
jgi:long-chain fatty acid transport protein